jgi:anti-sigma factor RsiW
MTCDRVLPLVAAAADGMLDADRRAALDAHLSVCDGCRTALADQMAVRAWLTRTPPLVVPAGFAQRVRGRIDEGEGLLGVADFRVWTLRLATLAALLALAAWLGLGAASTSAPTASGFTPQRAADWQRSVSGNALLEAALQPAREGEGDVR